MPPQKMDLQPSPGRLKQWNSTRTVGSWIGTAMFAIVAMQFCVSTVSGQTKKCDGMGERFCETAHKADVACPRPCNLKECAGNSRAPVKRAGAKRKISDGGTFYWEELALMGKYEYVYTDDDYLCMSACWKSPWAASCKKWETYMGNKYCLNLSCDHDDLERYSGCHADENGNRKMPWHKPTCKECLRIFPRACSNELKEYVESRGSSENDDDDGGDSSDVEEKSSEAPSLATKEQLEVKRLVQARNLETAARKYCYFKYFEDDKGVGGSVSSSESDDDNGGGIKVLEWMARMERDGHLECRAPQCFTQNTKLVLHRILPWYFQTFDGFCAWDKCGNDAKPHPTDWCSEKATHCFQCQSEWCPPSNSPPVWQPVEFDVYLANLEAAAQLVESPDFMDRSNCQDPVIKSLSRDEVQGLAWIQD